MDCSCQLTGTATQTRSVSCLLPKSEKRINILRACIVLTVMKLRVGVNQRSGTTEVFGGGDACELAEVVNEVRLVGVAEVESELGAVEGFARVKTFQQLMQAVTADDPLGRRAYIGLEEPLQCADAEAAAPCEGPYGEDGGVVQDGVDERCGECGVGVRCGHVWGEVCGCGRSHGFGGIEGAELRGEGENVWAENLRSGDDAIGERGDRGL